MRLMLGLCELRQGFREGTVTADPGAVPEGGGGLPWSGGAWQAAGWLAWDCPPKGAREEACWWPPDGWAGKEHRRPDWRAGRRLVGQGSE